MIKLKLGEMLDERKMTAYALHIKSGLHQSVISKIKRNMSKALQLDVLDTLCKALDCQPGELIAYENESATQGVNTQIVNATQNVERATQNVKQSTPKQKSKPFVHPGFTEALAEENSGKGFNHSILELSKSSSDNETLLSTEMVAERLGLKLSSVREHYNSGKLPFVKVGKKNKVRESDFIAFRDSRNLKKK
jgi:putative transcriptional regulator